MKWNVMGDEAALKKLVERWSSTRVVDRFSKTDINVELPDDDKRVDDFVEFAEELGLKAVML